MAEIEYRPEAPSDGFGHVTVPLPETVIEQECADHACRFIEEEDSGSFWCGCTDGRFVKICCAGARSALPRECGPNSGVTTMHVDRE